MKFSSILDKYTKFFCHCNEICSIVLVGSAVTSDNPTDIDVLLINTNQKKAIESIKTFSIKYKIPIIISDDAYRFQDGFIEVSLVPKKKTQIISDVKKIILGHNLARVYYPWAVGGFFPEVFISDLISALPVWEDKTRFTGQLQKYIDLHLSKFFNKLQQYLQSEIKLKTNYLRGLSSCNILFQKTLENDLEIANLRLSFAVHDLLFPGLKRSHEFNLSRAI